MAKIAENDSVNRINILAQEFVHKFAAPTALAERLCAGLEDMRTDFLERLKRWEVTYLDEIALSMVEPMRRVHRWRQHEEIAYIRAMTSSRISKNGHPWWRCLHWRFHSKAQRRQTRSAMVRALREKRCLNTFELSRQYVVSMSANEDGAFNADAYMRWYEGRRHYWEEDPTIPESVNMASLGIRSRVLLPRQLVSAAVAAPLILTTERALLRRIRETVNAAQVWPLSAVMDLPVTFLESASSMSTLINVKVLEAMKTLYTTSLLHFKEPLTIPEVAVGRLRLPTG